MQYQYCPNDPQRYATNLRREQGTRNLLWDNARGQDVLLVQTPFEMDAVDLMVTVQTHGKSTDSSKSIHGNSTKHLASVCNGSR